jgi:TM2 domain-containing membrane protein YozV
MNYYMADGNTRRGPFLMEQLMVQGLRADTLVWREGMPDWQQADSVPELRALLGQVGSPAFTPMPPPLQSPSFGGLSYSQSEVNSKKIAAGICGILLGSLGVHKFILGRTGAGLIMLLVTICTFGFGGLIMHPIGLIEGILYLTKTDEEFYRTYMVGQKSWF